MAANQMRPDLATAAGIFVAALSASLWFASAPAHAAPEDYETPEYNNSTGLEILNASEAYDLGFTGKGVTVGVVDSEVAPQEGEFAGKYPYGILPGPDDEEAHHGTHVGGIIGARRDGVGMHGMAFDAWLFPAAAFENLTEAWIRMNTVPGLRVINNSWGENVFADQSEDFDSGKLYSTFYYDVGDAFLKTWLHIPYRSELIDAALELTKSDKLIVFAAGNEGHLSPSGSASLPTLVKQYGNDAANSVPDADRALKLHWLNVAAFDPRYVEPDADGAWIPSGPAFPALFTNMGLYAADYTLWAPGVDIYSTIGPRQYEKMNGTSMAAPYVSGVAALTQSAFPYMGGKQIADVLLSTATKLDASNTPAVFLLMREEYVDETTENPETRNLKLFFNSDVYSSGLSESAIRARGEYEELIASIGQSLDHLGDDSSDPEDVLDTLATTSSDEEIAGGAAYLSPATGIDQNTYLELFGAGIVNAGKAVRGPGYLDANRLENSDKATYNGTDYAMYPVDTQGHDSTWSNDIGQKPVPDASDSYTDELYNLDVGLLKQGEGLLYLTGANTYEGMTDVAGGGISLGKTGQADETAKLAGAVYIGQDGMFTGNGYVDGGLESHGLLVPGLDSGPGNLKVNGDVTSDGSLLVYIWPKAGSANKLITNNDIDLNGTAVAVADMAGGHTLPTGNYAFIESGGTLSGSLVNADDVAMQGVTLLHTFALTTNGQTLSADYRGTEINPRAKALSEGFIGGTVMLNQGADLAAGAGIENAAGAARSVSGRATPGTGHGIAAFGVISGGWSRYNTGSHVDMKGVSLLTGFSSGRELPQGFLTLGAFFEFGSGFYDSYNSFGNAAAVHGDGETEYFGGGLLGRMDFSRTGPGRFHAEASARLGLTMTDYDGTGLRDYRGRAASYSSESAYYGLHAGLGYAWEMTEKATLDLYGKYFWTRQRGDRVTLSTGDPVRFKDADSRRARAGARFSYKVNDNLAPYLGAAYEHEFDGRVRASANGFSLPVPSLRGDTGVWELGIIAAPTDAHPALTMHVSVQGYTGKREGLSGNLQFTLKF